MTIEINDGTPFLADITATEGDKRYRVIVEDQGAAALYGEALDYFGQPYWLDASGTRHYRSTVGEIIVALVRQGSEFQGK